MATDATTTAVSSTADQFTSTDTLRALSPEQRAEWRMTGTLPDAPDPATKVADADSTPAQPAAQAVSTETTKAASEPADAIKPKTEARIHELLEGRAAEKARADQLQKQLDALMANTPAKTDAATASSPAPDVEALIRTPDVTQPELTDAEFFAKFPEATYGHYSRYTARYAVAETAARQAQTTGKNSRFEGFKAQLAKATEADPEFVAKLSPRVSALRPIDVLGPTETPTVLNDLAQEIVSAPNATALMTFLSAHPEALDRIEALTSHAALVREIGRIEGQIEASAAKAVEPQTVETRRTQVPDVPETVGRKAAVETDPVEGALARKDFTAYRLAANAREMAAAGIK